MLLTVTVVDIGKYFGKAAGLRGHVDSANADDRCGNIL